jgi:thiol-disulfide isomerase/thioredoxin
MNSHESPFDQMKMRILRQCSFGLLVATALLLPVVWSQASAQSAKYVPVTKYDPKRDAAADITNAIKEAQRTHKRILLEVGGQWCSWCHTLDGFFEAHRELTEFRDKNFVTVKINFSDENENKEVLSRYGEIPSFPYIFVLDSDGRLLLAKNTGDLESGKSYDLGRLNAFLLTWAPPAIRTGLSNHLSRDSIGPAAKDHFNSADKAGLKPAHMRHALRASGLERASRLHLL